MKEYCKMYYKYVAFFIISINIMLPGCTSVKLNPETQIVDGKCPDQGHPVQRLSEESYFFRLSGIPDEKGRVTGK